MDAAFLALETAESPMHVVGVLILDPAAGEGFSIERLRQVIADRLHLMPPFRRRLVQVPLALDKPYWEIDPDIDLDNHVFEVAVPPPGDLRELGRLVGQIGEYRLDRSIPLWELHVATGLADGRPARNSSRNCWTSPPTLRPRPRPPTRSRRPRFPAAAGCSGGRCCATPARPSPPDG